MKPLTIALILLGIAAFIGGVVWTTLQAAEVECEVCLVFGGTEVCRLGRGPSEEDARTAAQQSACGGNTSGMAESIACLNRASSRETCSAR
ncbi:MAG: hypothetical protein EXR92_02530 [Gemmatimonadetes bacterium]|nr:hypothetical protein [Gemmatimonadota bacterium]